MTTAGSAEVAQGLALDAVRARLAACAQVDGPIASTYWWQGGVETGQEWRITFKTTAQRYPELEARLRRDHEYEVPEIVCTPVIAGNPAYLAWVEAETALRG